MPKFFVLPEAADENEVRIIGDDARHIARSLRMAVGDEVVVSAGDGCDMRVRLTKIRDEECVGEIISREPSRAEPPYSLTLYMAMPKGDKLEVIVQKAVELGATSVVPFTSERCIKRPAEDKIEKITTRLSRIAKEAAGQCGRAVLPTVLPLMSFSEMLERLPAHDLALFCYEGEENTSIKSALAAERPKSIAVIVGAEGGFSKREAEEIKARGAVSVSLGRRILRCETAPDFVLSTISYNYEL